MTTRSPRPEKTKTVRNAVELAVLAVQGSPSIMDLPMADFDPSPGALDLSEGEHGETCSRCDRPAEDKCPKCGSPLCEDCIAGDEE